MYISVVDSDHVIMCSSTKIFTHHTEGHQELPGGGGGGGGRVLEANTLAATYEATLKFPGDGG